MSKHTPKPWYAAKTGNHQGLVISEATSENVAVTYNGDEDAALIAAAPDLLAALRECVTDDNANCIVTNDVCYMIRRFKAINAIVNTAIAKAE